jgi:hypothetical protein
VAFGPKTEGVLYHYTSHDTLYNIVESETLRASHVYYMNDSNEIKYAIDNFIKEVKERESLSGNAEETSFLQQFPVWLQNMRNNPHYIFSFSLSEKGNLLSQWRAYTPHGTGVSIGFNHSDIEMFASENELRLVQCIYNTKCQKSLLSAVLDYVLKEFEGAKSGIDTSRGPAGQEYHMYLNRFSGYLLGEFIKIKDPAFHEECEWRLESKFYESYADQDIQFRSGKTTLVPYVNFKIKDIRAAGGLFEQVYIGPSPNFELAYPAICAYLSNKGACSMKLNSQQPYREV